MKHYKCIKCDINYVEKEGDMCKLCKEDNKDSGYCIYCGGITTDGKDICDICLESLKLVEFENIFQDEGNLSNFDDE